MSIEHANMAWAGQYQGWYESMPVTISSNIKHKWLGGKMACYAVLCMSIEHACGFGVTTASNIKHMVYGIWPGPSSPQPLAEFSALLLGPSSRRADFSCPRHGHIQRRTDARTVRTCVCLLVSVSGCSEIALSSSQVYLTKLAT